LLLFLAALEFLRLELAAVTWNELSGAVLHVPWWRIAAAIAVTAANYAVLTGYDLLAFTYAGRKLPAGRVAAVSFLAYAISNNIGFAMLSGASVRYRFYTRWGITTEELSRIVFSYSVTFWLGLFALGGISLVFGSLADVQGGLRWGTALAPAGWLLIGVVVAYVVASAVRKEPLHLGSVTLPLPPVRIALGQLALSVVDWTLAAAVLYLLLPAPPPFVAFVGAFQAAILVGMLSHVPGGLGVFEGLIVLLLKPYVPSTDLVPALVVYRAVYYFLPLTVALIGLVGYAVNRQRHHAARVGAVFGRVSELITPRLLAGFTFFAGVVLLFSGATPAAPGRLERLDRLFPLGVVEASHFLGSIAGTLLLLLSQGLARRLDAAYYLTVTAIGAGIAASLLKGFDYEEAAILAFVLAVLVPARSAFDRRAALFDTRFSPAWIAALASALGASIWLGFFAFKHVGYSDQLWWQFELGGEASRFLRATVGSVIALMLFAVWRLLSHAPYDAVPPTARDLDDAAAIIGRQTSTSPFLVFLGDKSILFTEDRQGFLMYGVQGRTWVALGDPVGTPAQTTELIRLFLERCDDVGGTPVFYEVGRHHLHRYADFGLAFAKLGEEARIDLKAFTVNGGSGARFRQILRRLEKAGGTFRIVEAADVPSIMPRLREISDAWLAQKGAAEKGFSLGFFNEPYLLRFPVAVIEVGGAIQAFANVWPGPELEELSIDLMRYHHDAPPEVMEGLLIHLIQWGKRQGYHWFAFGMAPLSGFERSAGAPLWNRVGAFVYAHGEAMYNFQGLRAYKQKFHPAWEPRYLAYPGGLKLARILADASALISGGYRRIFLK
jgi:phosphatidylglycerol lysyltransferase